MNVSIVLVVGAWILYCGLHSLLAADRVRLRLQALAPPLGRHYRLCYNLLACLFLALPLAAMRAAAGPALWVWDGRLAVVQYAAVLAAFFIFFVSARAYDMRDFLGLAPAAGGKTASVLALSPLHRFVRHPWYLAGLILIWSQDMDPARLSGAVVLTLYLAIGSGLEERRLLGHHGALYQEYRQRVPGLFPLPWKFLSKKEARRLSGQPR